MLITLELTARGIKRDGKGISVIEVVTTPRMKLMVATKKNAMGAALRVDLELRWIDGDTSLEPEGEDLGGMI